MVLIGRRSIHAAHAVDRDLFDEGIRLDQCLYINLGLNLTLRCDELFGSTHGMLLMS
jgi:hypothetical protein